MSPARPRITEIRIADPPERWAALGFAVEGGRADVGDADASGHADVGGAHAQGSGHADVGGVRLTFGVSGRGIVAVAMDDVGPTDIDGLVVDAAPPPPDDHPRAPHPNRAIAVDHVVAVTPAFDRTAAALAEAGLPLRRIREAGGSRQGFRRAGPVILELVEGDAPVRFWGLTITVPELAEGRPAVQPGRRNATVSPAAGLSTRLAFMTP